MTTYKLRIHQFDGGDLIISINNGGRDVKSVNFGKQMRSFAYPTVLDYDYADYIIDTYCAEADITRDQIEHLDAVRRILAEYTDKAAGITPGDMPAEATNRQRVGAKIAEARQAAGLTIRALAELAGVSAQNITKIEHGKYNVSIDILSKVLAPLGLQIDFAKSE